MSPAKKFSPVSCTPGVLDRRDERVDLARPPGTAAANGHQNSTASNPAALTAAGRSSSGSSVNSSEQFTV